jgi:hypothetical protein
MTGGDSYRVDAGAADVFERLARETSGYYRLGVERENSDLDGKARPLAVDVTRRGLKVRAPQRFFARSYAERDVPSRLETAMSAPLPATGLGLQVTSYLQANPQRTSQVRVVLVGTVSRLQPGDVTLQMALRRQSEPSDVAYWEPIHRRSGDGPARVLDGVYGPARAAWRQAGGDGRRQVWSARWITRWTRDGRRLDRLRPAT